MVKKISFAEKPREKTGNRKEGFTALHLPQRKPPVTWRRNSRGLPFESDADACRKIKIKPLRETNMGVAHAKTRSPSCLN